MRQFPRSITALACLILSAAAYAAPVALPAEVQSPDVVGLVLFDMTKLSVNDLKTTSTAILGDAAETMQEGMAEYEKNQKRFIDAGGQYLGFVVSMSPEGSPREPVMVIKLSDPSKAGGMKTLVQELAPKNANSVVSDLKDGWMQVTGGRAVPLAGGGDAEAGKTLAAGLANAGDSPVTLVFVPNDAIRAQMAQAQGMMQPAMAELVNQISVAKWISGGVHVGQAPDLNLTVQTADDAAATALQNSLTATVEQMRPSIAQFKTAISKGMNVSPQMAPMVAGMMVLDGMKVQAKGAQVAMGIGTDSLKEVGGVLGPALAAARASAKSMQSTVNMRQLGIAMQVYATDHDGAFPAKLDDLAKYAGSGTPDGLKTLLTNPVTGEYPGYVYEQPADPKADAATTVVLRELKDGKPNEDGAKLFLDGHVSHGLVAKPPAPAPK